MLDKITNGGLENFRETALRGFDNRVLAKFIWVSLALGASAIGTFVPILSTVEPAQSPVNYGPILTLLGGFLVWIVVFAFMGSLVYPTRQLEAWFDRKYPRFSAREIPEYRLWEDLVASLVQSFEWGLQMAGIYVFVAVVLVSSASLHAFAESGYQLTTENTQTLTVINSFGVLLLSGAFIAAMAYWLTKNHVSPVTEHLSTPATSAFVGADFESDTTGYSPSDIQVTDGGPETREEAVHDVLSEIDQEDDS